MSKMGRQQRTTAGDVCHFPVDKCDKVLIFHDLNEPKSSDRDYLCSECTRIRAVYVSSVDCECFWITR